MSTEETHFQLTKPRSTSTSSLTLLPSPGIPSATLASRKPDNLRKQPELICAPTVAERIRSLLQVKPDLTGQPSGSPPDRSITRTFSVAGQVQVLEEIADRTGFPLARPASMSVCHLPRKPTSPTKGLDRDNPFPRRGADFEPYHITTPPNRPSSPSSSVGHSRHYQDRSPSPSDPVGRPYSSAISPHTHRIPSPLRSETSRRISVAERVNRLDTLRGEDAMDSRMGFGRRGTLRFASPAVRTTSSHEHHRHPPSTPETQKARSPLGPHEHYVSIKVPVAAERHRSARDRSPVAVRLNDGLRPGLASPPGAPTNPLQPGVKETETKEGLNGDTEREMISSRASELPNIGKKRDSPSSHEASSVTDRSETTAEAVQADTQGDDIPALKDEHESNETRSLPRKLPIKIDPLSSNPASEPTLGTTAITSDDLTSLIDAVILEHRGALENVMSNLQSAGVIVAEIRNLPGSFKRAVVVTRRPDVAPLLAEQLSADASPLKHVEWATGQGKEGKSVNIEEDKGVKDMRRKSQGMMDLIKLVEQAAEEISSNSANDSEGTSTSASRLLGSASSSDNQSDIEEPGLPGVPSTASASGSSTPSISDAPISPTTIAHANGRTVRAKSITDYFLRPSTFSFNPIKDRIKRWKTEVLRSANAQPPNLDEELRRAEQLEAERYPEGSQQRAWHSSQPFASSSTIQDTDSDEIPPEQPIASPDPEVLLASYRAIPPPPDSLSDCTPRPSPSTSPLTSEAAVEDTPRLRPSFSLADELPIEFAAQASRKQSIPGAFPSLDDLSIFTSDPPTPPVITSPKDAPSLSTEQDSYFPPPPLVSRPTILRSSHVSEQPIQTLRAQHPERANSSTSPTSSPSISAMSTSGMALPAVPALIDTSPSPPPLYMAVMPEFAETKTTPEPSSAKNKREKSQKHKQKQKHGSKRGKGKDDKLCRHGTLGLEERRILASWGL